MNCAETVAKGIETIAQKEALAHTGCDWAQGYFFSKPLTAEKLKPLLQNNCSKNKNGGLL